MATLGDYAVRATRSRELFPFGLLGSELCTTMGLGLVISQLLEASDPAMRHLHRVPRSRDHRFEVAQCSPCANETELSGRDALGSERESIAVAPRAHLLCELILAPTQARLGVANLRRTARSLS